MILVCIAGALSSTVSVYKPTYVYGAVNGFTPSKQDVFATLPYLQLPGLIQCLKPFLDKKNLRCLDVMIL